MVCIWLWIWAWWCRQGRAQVLKQPRLKGLRQLQAEAAPRVGGCLNAVPGRHLHVDVLWAGRMPRRAAVRAALLTQRPSTCHFQAGCRIPPSHVPATAAVTLAPLALAVLAGHVHPWHPTHTWGWHRLAACAAARLCWGRVGLTHGHSSTAVVRAVPPNMRRHNTTAWPWHVARGAWHGHAQTCVCYVWTHVDA